MYTARVDHELDAALPLAVTRPERLHDAMRYAVLNGGKRVRPLLVYATGECLDVDPKLLDVPAVAIELIHAFSLVHDDLPAMDDDDLGRGRPTNHKVYGEANAILAKNRGIIASFSRALTEGLSAQQSDSAFDAALGAAIDSIHAASVAG